MGKIYERFRTGNTIKSNLSIHIKEQEQENTRVRKGLYLGRCNYTNCDDPRVPATWYNRGSYAFYCKTCAKMLNHANRNDEFCKDEPLCRVVETEEEAKTLHVMVRYL